MHHLLSNRPLLAAVLLVALSHLLPAQSPEGADVSFRVLCLEHRDDITSAFAAGPSSALVEVPFYTSGFSDPLRARFQGGRADLFVEEKSPDGKTTRRVVASGKLASADRQAFVLIPNDAGTGPEYRILAFDDREQSFAMGATRVINFARFPIRLNLAGTNLDPVKPGGISTFPMVRKVDEWNMFTARIEFQVAADQWIEVSTQSWKASELKRDWVVIRFDEQTRQPVIRLFQDIPPARRAMPRTPAGS